MLARDHHRAFAQADFGENFVHDATPKIDALRARALTWHFIGQLQRRKVRDAIGTFELIHSVDSVELARQAGKAHPG